MVFALVLFFSSKKTAGPFASVIKLFSRIQDCNEDRIKTKTQLLILWDYFSTSILSVTALVEEQFKRLLGLFSRDNVFVKDQLHLYFKSVVKKQNKWKIQMNGNDGFRKNHMQKINTIIGFSR